MTTAPPDRQRIDKWLYFARVVKTRALAVKLVTSGHVRINGEKKRTPSATVKPGDALTIVMPRRVFVYRVIDCGERRGPASEAQTLYEDISPPPIDTGLEPKF
ncbi:MAG: RNA-binding protein [Hoeflea sp.]|nr:RNA-binding protein [Hoeflea sp.]|tara:strand:- start:912 stop:1220 length:309 start_codon:yes stop_codon:yes gene_type:complete